MPFLLGDLVVAVLLAPTSTSARVRPVSGSTFRVARVSGTQAVAMSGGSPGASFGGGMSFSGFSGTFGNIDTPVACAPVARLTPPGTPWSSSLMPFEATG